MMLLCLAKCSYANAVKWMIVFLYSGVHGDATDDTAADPRAINR